MEVKSKISLFKDKSLLQENRYIMPCKEHITPAHKVCYENAVDFAKSINLHRNERIYAIISGDFVLCDFIEAFVDYGNFDVKEMTICTLSLSQDNVDSLSNIFVISEQVEKLNLIVSGYFYRNEIQKIVKHIYQELDKRDAFQFAVCETHTKICQFETHQGGKCIIYGSANLRSSQSVEQITVEENAEIYDFNQNYFNAIIEKYKTINKSIHYRDLFKLIEEVSNKTKHLPKEKRDG